MPLLGKDKAKRLGRGIQRSYSPLEVIAIAAGIRWMQEGAEPDRVKGIIRFVAGLTAEHMEAAFAEGRTFPVPREMFGEFELPIGGMLIKPPIDDSMSEGSRELMRRLDLRPLWDKVKSRISNMGEPQKRGRKPKRRLDSPMDATATVAVDQ
jgi:hypothetical protein